MITLDWPHRPNVEKVTVPMFAGVAVVLGVLYAQGVLSMIAFAMSGVLCIAIIANDLLRARHLSEARKTHAVTRITPAKLFSLARENPNSLYMGMGYELTTEQARAIYAIQEGGLDAKFKTDDEVMNFGATWLRLLDKPKPIFVPMKYTEGHSAIFGTTRAGKTRCLDLVLNQCVARNECCVLLDPKGDNDLEARFRRACARAGMQYNYLHLAHPEKCVRINPLRNGTFATELASRIAANMGGEAFNPFRAVSQMALTQIIGGMQTRNIRPTLADIYRYLHRGVDELIVDAVKSWATQQDPRWIDKARKMMMSYKGKGRADVDSAEFMSEFYLKVLSKEHPNDVLDGLISQFKHDRTHFDKMVISLLPLLENLTAGELGPLFSPDPSAKDERRIVNLFDIMARGEGLYVGLNTLSQSDTGSAVGAILCADAVACAADRYNYPDPEVPITPVNFFIEEAAEVINDPVVQILNKAGGAKFRTWLVAQTDGDYEVRVGRRAKVQQILGNVNNMYSFRIQDRETQKLMTSKLRDTTIVDVLASESVDDDGVSRISRRQGTRQAPIFPESLFSSLPNLDYVATLQSGSTVVGRIPLLEDA